VDVQQQRDSDGASWKERIASTNRFTPADEAAFRIDFGIWLHGLPDRRRQTAVLLAAGHGTKAVAEQLGVTPAAVSLARPWLAASWHKFQGEMSVLSGE
jgi:DNA-binding NarL/FixJ family response regulator